MSLHSPSQKSYTFAFLVPFASSHNRVHLPNRNVPCLIPHEVLVSHSDWRFLSLWILLLLISDFSVNNSCISGPISLYFSQLSFRLSQHYQLFWRRLEFRRQYFRGVTTHPVALLVRRSLASSEVDRPLLNRGADIELTNRVINSTSWFILNWCSETGVHSKRCLLIVATRLVLESLSLVEAISF